VAALESGDTEAARALMLQHIGHVEQALQTELPTAHALDGLRARLAPVQLP